MRIILDAMGGDNAPEEIVKGAIWAVNELGANLVLVGNKEKINKIFDENNISGSVKNRFEIVHTETVISMKDEPVSVVRSKRESSLGIALKMLSEDKNDEFGALVSAGNSGALLAGASILLKNAGGIKRAALAVLLPYEKKTLLIDAGANIETKSEFLKQFGVMGSVYMNKIFNTDCPTVGLANNGAESSKGTPEHVEAYKLLSECKNIHFVGNIEGRDITTNAPNVLVTDGFTGNMILKLTEGFGIYMSRQLKQMFTKDIFTKASSVLMKDSLRDFKRSFDQSEYGGAPFLGVRKTVIKAHGSSDAKTIKNAIRQAKFCIENKIIEEIENNCE